MNIITPTHSPDPSNRVRTLPSCKLKEERRKKKVSVWSAQRRLGQKTRLECQKDAIGGRKDAFRGPKRRKDAFGGPKTRLEDKRRVWRTKDAFGKNAFRKNAFRKIAFRVNDENTLPRSLHRRLDNIFAALIEK